MNARVNWIGLAALFLVGCAFTHTDVRHGGAQPRFVYKDDLPCVMLAKDGRNGTAVGAGSGQTLSLRTLESVQTYWPAAQLITTSDVATAESLCRSNGGNFLVVPQLTRWEDHNTPWTGVRDVLTVTVQLNSLDPPEVVRSVEFSARNDWFTLKDGRPTDLLDRDYDLAINKLMVAQ